MSREFLRRCLVVLGGYAVASWVAAGSAIAGQAVVRQHEVWPPTLAQLFLLGAFTATPLVIAASALPALPIIVVLERAGARAAVTYAASGALAAFAAIVLAEAAIENLGILEDASLILVGVAAGLAGGLVYWRVAVRGSSGSWVRAARLAALSVMSRGRR